MGVNSLPKTVTQQHRNYDLNPGPSVPESSTLTSRLQLLVTNRLWQTVEIVFGQASRVVCSLLEVISGIYFQQL